MDGINPKYDRLYSIQGTEWHGKARHVDSIGETEATDLSFDIHSVPAVAEINGMTVPLEGWQTLMADFSYRDNLVEEEKYLPLHVAKKGYEVIPNAVVWNAQKEALAKIDHTITTVGTLESGRRFFTCVQLADSSFVANGDKFLSFVIFVTSHDGSLSFRIYDSTTRVVCMNTLQASLSDAGALNYRVRHTKNAQFAIENLPSLVDASLSGRAKFVDNLGYLASRNVTQSEAQNIIAGFFALKNAHTKRGVKDLIAKPLSTRAFNAIESIHTLFNNGKGNHGKTYYDLLNGATEYWTHGDGTGKTANPLQKAYKSEFGAAADYKKDFANYLMATDEKMEGFARKGAALLADYYLAQ